MPHSYCPKLQEYIEQNPNHDEVKYQVKLIDGMRQEIETLLTETENHPWLIGRITAPQYTHCILFKLPNGICFLLNTITGAPYRVPNGLLPPPNMTGVTNQPGTTTHTENSPSSTTQNIQESNLQAEKEAVTNTLSDLLFNEIWHEIRKRSSSRPDTPAFRIRPAQMIFHLQEELNALSSWPTALSPWKKLTALILLLNDASNYIDMKEMRYPFQNKLQEIKDQALEKIKATLEGGQLQIQADILITKNPSTPQANKSGSAKTSSPSHKVTLELIEKNSLTQPAGASLPEPSQDQTTTETETTEQSIENARANKNRPKKTKSKKGKKKKSKKQHNHSDTQTPQLEPGDTNHVNIPSVSAKYLGPLLYKLCDRETQDALFNYFQNTNPLYLLPAMIEMGAAAPKEHFKPTLGNYIVSTNNTSNNTELAISPKSVFIVLSKLRPNEAYEVAIIALYLKTRTTLTDQEWIEVTSSLYSNTICAAEFMERPQFFQQYLTRWLNIILQNTYNQNEVEELLRNVRFSTIPSADQRNISHEIEEEKGEEDPEGTSTYNQENISRDSLNSHINTFMALFNKILDNLPHTPQALELTLSIDQTNPAGEILYTLCHKVLNQVDQQASSQENTLCNGGLTLALTQLWSIWEEHNNLMPNLRAKAAQYRGQLLNPQTRMHAQHLPPNQESHTLATAPTLPASSLVEEARDRIYTQPRHSTLTRQQMLVITKFIMQYNLRELYGELRKNSISIDDFRIERTFKDTTIAKTSSRVTEEIHLLLYSIHYNKVDIIAIFALMSGNVNAPIGNCGAPLKIAFTHRKHQAFVYLSRLPEIDMLALDLNSIIETPYWAPDVAIKLLQAYVTYREENGLDPIEIIYEAIVLCLNHGRSDIADAIINTPSAITTNSQPPEQRALLSLNTITRDGLTIFDIAFRNPKITVSTLSYIANKLIEESCNPLTHIGPNIENDESNTHNATNKHEGSNCEPPPKRTSATFVEHILLHIDTNNFQSTLTLLYTLMMRLISGIYTSPDLPLTDEEEQRYRRTCSYIHLMDKRMLPSLREQFTEGQTTLCYSPILLTLINESLSNLLTFLLLNKITIELPVVFFAITNTQPSRITVLEKGRQSSLSDWPKLPYLITQNKMPLNNFRTLAGMCDFEHGHWYVLGKALLPFQEHFVKYHGPSDHKFEEANPVAHIVLEKHKKAVDWMIKHKGVLGCGRIYNLSETGIFRPVEMTPAFEASLARSDEMARRAEATL